MRHAPSLEFLQRELRLRVCRRCYLRPAGTHSRGPDHVRRCEARCAIFAMLPRVRMIAEYLDPMVEPYRRALNDLYSGICNGGAGGVKHKPPIDRRPLRRYQRRVVETLTEILDRNA
jgi:hypothetical protein